MVCAMWRGVHELVAGADVFVQNFRQGVARKLGLDYAALREHNPRGAPTRDLRAVRTIRERSAVIAGPPA